MKKFLVLFSALALVFVACNKDEEEDDGTLKEKEITYVGTYEGQYKLADTTYDKEVFFINGLLKDRIKLYGVVNFDQTETPGYFKANVSDTELEVVKLLLGFVGVNIPDNADNLIKGLNATAMFDGAGKVTMDLNFDFDVQIVDTMNLNWRLIHYEGLRK